MVFQKFLSVVQRRLMMFDDSEADLAALLESAFLIDTHMSFLERVELFRLARSLPQDFVACEVGSYLGASTAFLALAATLLGGHVHAVDTWQNDAMPHEPAEDTFERFLDNTHTFRHVITTHRGRAAELVHEVPQVNLLFLDGDHSYEGTKANLDDYAPKIKPGGYIALHDFDYDDVRRAVGDAFGPAATDDVGRTETLKVLRVE